MVTKTQSTTANTGTQLASKNSKMNLKTEDFIKMMLTQLQQQDPMEPAKNEQLLAQMSQIGQLQANTTLNESLQGVVKQNQVGAAAGMIGKTVKGMDDKNAEIAGTVTSVRVTDDGVNLELDSGKSLSLGRVTSIATPAAAPAKVA